MNSGRSTGRRHTSTSTRLWLATPPCLTPGDLPEFIEVDVSGMDIGDSLHLSDIVLPSGVELTALQQGPENDATVVGIATARAEVPETEEESEIGAEPEEGSAED